MDDLKSSGATVMLGVPLLWEAAYRRIIDTVNHLPGGRVRFALGMAIGGAADVLGLRGVRKRLFSEIHERFGGSLRLMISGGAAIDPEVVRGFEKLGFSFLQGYGLTETSPIVSVNRIGGNRFGSVGLPLPDMEVCIREADASGIGEITVRGPNVMKGYHDDQTATAEVLSEDGWFRTGDFGYLDNDGYLFVTGRKKNVIVAKNGKNVFPEEIETVLNRSEVVSESMVFGRESHLKGEEIWVVVVPDEENLAGGNAEEAVRRDIRKYNAATAPYRHISVFILREEELPRTTSRKIQRRNVFPDGCPGDENAHRV
jgi:long-chain acyl-CoA synthetase